VCVLIQKIVIFFVKVGFSTLKMRKKEKCNRRIGLEKIFFYFDN